MSPVFGIGLGEYKYFTPEVTDGHLTIVAHNWYATVLAEQGAIGTVVWLLMLVAIVSWLRRLPAVPRRLGFAVFSAVCAGSFFLQPPTHFQTAVLPAVAVTAAAVAKWGDSRREAGATAERALAPFGYVPHAKQPTPSASSM
jgi:O-antigen ligase